MNLLDLGHILLERITSHVPDEDVLAWAMTCKPLHDAEIASCGPRKPCGHARPHNVMCPVPRHTPWVSLGRTPERWGRKIWTPVRAFLSPSRAAWIACWPKSSWEEWQGAPWQGARTIRYKFPGRPGYGYPRRSSALTIFVDLAAELGQVCPAPAPSAVRGSLLSSPNGAPLLPPRRLTPCAPRAAQEP